MLNIECALPCLSSCDGAVLFEGVVFSDALAHAGAVHALLLGLVLCRQGIFYRHDAQRKNRADQALSDVGQESQVQGQGQRGR